MGSDKKQKKTGGSNKVGLFSLEKAFGIVLVSLVAIMLVVSVVLYLQINRRIEDGNRAAVNHLARTIDGQVRSMMQHYNGLVGQLASSPELPGLIASGNVEAIRKKEHQLARLVPGALRVRLLDTGPVALGGYGNPPVSYACQELLGRVIQGKTPPSIEVHKLGSPEQHIDIARRISDSDGQVVGRILVSMSVSTLQKQLKTVSIPSGYVEIRQERLVLARHGSKPTGEPAVTRAIPGSRWSLQVWMNPDESSYGLGGQIQFWGVMAGGLLLLIAVSFMVYRKVRKALHADQVAIIHLFKDTLDETPGPERQCHLKNNTGIMRQLHKMARDKDVPAAAKAVVGIQESEIDEIGYSAPDALEVTEIDGSGVAMAKTGVRETTEGSVPASIFRAYDIRGIVGETLTADNVYLIGRAIGSEAYERGQQQVVVARDGRLSGPELSRALIKGLVSTGREVIDIGQVPTPVLYFANHYLGTGSGVMLTGSHNPVNYNGLKMVLRGETLHGDSIRALRTRIETGQLVDGEGSVQSLDIEPSYLERVVGDIHMMRPLKVVVDCGNGVAGEIAPKLLRQLGCEVIEMFCDIDGNFPNHHPDPGKPENLTALARAVPEQGADIGIAFDGDGDRIGVIDSRGKIIWPDRLLMLLARQVLKKNPGGKIIYDVKCSRNLENVIKEGGGDPLMWKTGHSFIKHKMHETGALLAGEMSGHIFYKERWYGFDDALYTMARLLEILSAESKESSRLFAGFPESVSTPELNILMREGEHFRLMDRLHDTAEFTNARVIDIDGLRVEFEDGWGLIRASNTTPSLVLRFEAGDAEGLRRIQDEFRKQLLALDPQLELPF